MRAPRAAGVVVGVVAAFGAFAGCRSIIGYEDGSPIEVDASGGDTSVDDTFRSDADATPHDGDGSAVDSPGIETDASTEARADGDADSAVSDSAGESDADADADVATDSSADADTVDAASDAIDASDTGPDKFDDPTRWSSFDVSFVNANAHGYFGGAFDGKNVYLAPYGIDSRILGGHESGLATRYDSSYAGSFTTSSSAWSTFDLPTNVYSSAKDFGGAAFDGKYLYYIPLETYQVARYDTTSTAAFSSSKPAWSLFNLNDAGIVPYRFFGGAFDGKYLYVAPVQPAFTGAVNILQYDTTSTAAFSSSAAAWAHFDVQNLTPKGNGFEGIAFDGKYLYFAPYFDGVVVRYDPTTGVPFGSTSLVPWKSFDVSAVDAGAVQFCGAAFDGRYVYFAPRSMPTAIIARYDTTMTFASTGSWQVFNLSAWNAKAQGFDGAVFDGRYLYLVPGEYVNSTVVRFDTTTTLDFTSSGAAWSAYDVTALDSAAKGYVGGVFDGRYVYFVPFDTGPTKTNPSGIVVRYDATRGPHTIPTTIPGYFAWGPGSFF